MFPHTIRLLCEALDADASAGIVGGLVFNFDGSEQRGCRRREPTLARSLEQSISTPYVRYRIESSGYDR